MEYSYWRRKIFSLSSDLKPPLEDKQQKRGENVENIKFTLDTQLNFMFSTYSPLFCCLSTRGPDVSHPSLRLLYIFSNPGLLCGVHSISTQTSQEGIECIK